MSLQNEAWAALNHGGLLISTAKLADYFPDTLPQLPDWQIEKLRRALTAFDGTNETLAPLLDYFLQNLTGLPADEWKKAQNVEADWAIRSFTGVQVKPRRLWVGPNGETLPVFVPEEGASRQFSGRLGVGRSRVLLGRVLEWLRRQQQPLALVTNGRQWRLVHAGQDYDAWCEWDIDLWFVEGQPGPQTLAWRCLLNRETLLAPEGLSRLQKAISESRKGQAELSSVLGERVRQGVEELITASHGAIEQARNDGQQLEYSDLYVAGSRIIMRSIIALFAEARALLPVDNPIYQQAYGLEGLRQQLDRRAGGRGSERLSRSYSAWPRMLGLFNLIHFGSAHPQLAVPQYGGALFQPGDVASDDPINRALALLESTANTISDRQVHKLLRLLTRTRMKVRQGRASRWVDAPVDFSTLSSEYIGILYEGLLDFELKQAAEDDPVIFLGVGNQPALTLSQLEAMDDKTIKQLFETLKKGDSAGDESEEEESNEAQAVDSVTEDHKDAADAAEPEAETPAAEDDDDTLQLSEDHLARAQAWLEKAALLAGLVKKPRGKKAAALAEQQEMLTRATKQLCVRLVAPGQFYLVRWGGTRKGAGTFYTRPQLAAPTVRRTLQPLAFDALRTDIDPRTGLENVLEWQPKPPEAILALKICDPAMGSGSFLAGALRYLTDALVQSLYQHGLLEKDDEGGVPRMADGQLATLLSDEFTKLNPAHPDFEESLRAQLKRHIVERCLYGVDLDPLAVELGRMALWVETMDRDLPFGFLDHKLKVGNALVGTWFNSFRHYPAMAWQREGGDKDYQKNKPANLINHFYVDDKDKKKGDVFNDAIKARGKNVQPQLMALLSGQMDAGSSLDVSTVHDELFKVFRKLHRLPVHASEKRATLYREQVLNSPHYHAIKQRMDLWCALWFWPGDKIERAPLPLEFATPDKDVLDIASAVAREKRFFHWELEFPDVFTAKQDGFDGVLGNPPWEIQKPNSKEFFSNHDPLYRAYGKQEALTKQLEYFRNRTQLEHDWIAYNAGLKGMSNWAKYVGQPFGDKINEDKKGNKKHVLNLGGRSRDSFKASQALHKKWQKQRNKHKGFADTAHPFLHQGSADLNTYKLFLELSHALLRGVGRLGMIVPSGIYTDKGTTALRELFLEHCDWQWLFGFENREGVFDIHRSFKFCPLIIQKGGETGAIRAAFMHRNVDDWEQAERHVLAYPRERVLEFSPYSKAILEIRSEQDLQVLQKIYANGVLLGDKSEQGWGIKYATEFHMTNDSKLFPPRPKWEDKGYKPDEYGHWLKGDWQDYSGPENILDREPGLVLSRDGKQALVVEQIEDVALPLLEGNIVDQFQVSSKGWVSGKGRSAVWRDILPGEETFEPQYLMGLEDAASKVYKTGDLAGQAKWLPIPKITFIDVTSATNARTARATCTPFFPCGNTSPIFNTHQPVFALATAINSFVYDFLARARCGGLHLNWFVVEESVLPNLNFAKTLNSIGQALIAGPKVFSPAVKPAGGRKLGILPAERVRLRCISDAVVAHSLALLPSEFCYILSGCDFPREVMSDAFTSKLNPKGFWRIDKHKDPELRHTVLSLIAFHDLQEKGLDAFLSQNNGEGWLIPETLRLADYGLGHDDRAKEHQPVAERLGPRFYDWQLNEDVERSWQECEAHAALIRKIVPLPGAGNSEADNPNDQPPKKNEQGALFS